MMGWASWCGIRLYLKHLDLIIAYIPVSLHGPITLCLNHQGVVWPKVGAYNSDLPLADSG